MKKKILTISDMPFAKSGVGIQTKRFIEGILDTGKYQVISVAGARKHKDPSPFMTEKYGEDWKVIPVEGFGNHDMIRGLITAEKPDALWLMTDPRFFEWLWDIDNEIRKNLPIIYYHVWDNYPYPKFNIPKYESNDVIVSISKLTHDVVQTLSPKVKSYYLPHSVDTDVFKPKPKEALYKLLKMNGIDASQKKIFFWNNRNARRKQPGSLMWWFKELLDEVGHEEAMLIMHTDPHDPHGPDIIKNLEDLGLTDGQIFVSNSKVPEQLLSNFYNMADCTINIADAEGFGLSSLESMACGTPLISTMTGGLQDQIFDGENWFGIGIEPKVKSLVGSQDVPYIYEDKISAADFKQAARKIIAMSREEIDEWGTLCRKNVLERFSTEQYVSGWLNILEETFERCGSWETRKLYKNWSIEEI